MSISTYSELQTAANEYAERDDAASLVKEWIALGEAKLNRKLGAVETDASLTGTLDSRRIDLSSLSIVVPIALWLAESGSDEVKIDLMADGTFAYLNQSDKPTKAGFDVSMTYIDFDVPLDSAYPFRFRYRQRFALSDSATTNWLLTNHSDVYLAATMMWGAAYRESGDKAAGWNALLSDAIPEIRNVIAESRRGMLQVDEALVRIGQGQRPTWDNGFFE